MRVPHEALRESIVVEDYRGAGAYGVAFEDPRILRANVQRTERLEVTTHGRQLLATTLVIIRPEAGPVPVESKVTWNGDEFRVVRAFAVPDTRRPSHWELSIAPWQSSASEISGS
jgi:hypothetical protein